jgi:predicted alpha/beta-fold hydrolase
VLLLHGVAGCHGSPYLVRTAHKLNRCGIRTFRLDFRGMGAGRLLARRPAHAGRSADVRAAIEWMVAACPGSPQTLVGFSMGGNIALKLLGESPQALPAALDSALAIAPPIDLTRCARNLDRGVQRWYSRSLTRMLLRTLRDRQHLLEDLPTPLSRLPRRLWDFDDWITAPLSGFSGAADYYAQNSAAPLLARIQVPTLIVTASDDPLIPVAMFHETPLARHVQLQITQQGGHIGYYAQGGSDPDRWWLDWRIVEAIVES